MQTSKTIEGKTYPLGKPGRVATYQHESEDPLVETVVKTLTLAIGSIKEKAGIRYQWMCLRAMKASGEKFVVWLLSKSTLSENIKIDNPTISRYILQIGDDIPLEFHDRFMDKPVLPKLGAWQYLFPKPTDNEIENASFPHRDA